MHATNEFLKSLALVLGVAALTTVLFQRLRQPVVLGYMLAGLIIGPHVPVPLVADAAVVETLSELGVILLMFSLGLEFSFAKLARVGPAASLTAAVQSGLMVWVGYAVGQWMGWTRLESLFTGALVAISSTTIIAKAFDDQRIKGRLRELVVGVLVVEDLIAIMLMAVLTALAAGKGLSVQKLLGQAVNLGGFLMLLVVGGLLLVPRAIRAVARFGNSETLLISSVGVCFGMALLARQAGYSVALGAFLAGSLVAESGKEKEVERLVAPVRDIFAAVFFVSVGMMLDPALAFRNWQAVMALTLAVVLGKVLFVAGGAFLTGQGIRDSARAGLSLAQIGEFSFIIAGLGVALGAVGRQLYPVAVSVSALTTLLTPWMIRASGPLAERFEAALPPRLQTFASLYGAWVERLRGEKPSPGLRARSRRMAAWLLVDIALLGGLIIAGALHVGRASALLHRELGLPPLLSTFAVALIAMALALPLCYGIFALTRQLSVMLAMGALPAGKQGMDTAAAPRQSLVAAFQIGLLAASAAPLLLITQPFLPGLVVAGGLALVFAAAGFLFWKRAAELQGHVRAGTQMLMEALASQGRRGDALKKLEALGPLLSGLGEPRTVKLPQGCRAHGKPLSALKLRGLCGATVLAVERGGRALEVRGGLVLEAGDLVALAGSTPSVDMAQEILTGNERAGGEANA